MRRRRRSPQKRSEMNKILIYGKPAAGKTTFLGSMAEYIWKNFKKKTRIVTSDGGGVEPFNTGIELGFIEAVDISNWANPFVTFEAFTKGWWPVDVNVLNSPVLPGFRYWKMCPLCKGDSGSVGLAAVKTCTSCKKDIPVGAPLLPQRDFINGMENVGAYGFEGLTSWGDRTQQLMSDKLAAGDPGASAGGQDSSKGGSSLRFQDGLDNEGKAFFVAGNAMPHYGASVDYLNRFVRYSDMLPGWKCWTALERLGKEEETKKSIMGPSVPGRLGVDKVIGWFNSVLHLDLVEGKQDANGVPLVDRVVFLNTHYAKDVPGVPFLAKLSATPAAGTPTTIPPSFGVFLEALEKARATAKARVLKELGE